MSILAGQRVATHHRAAFIRISIFFAEAVEADAGAAAVAIFCACAFQGQAAEVRDSAYRAAKDITLSAFRVGITTIGSRRADLIEIAARSCTKAAGTNETWTIATVGIQSAGLGKAAAATARYAEGPSADVAAIVT